MAVGKPDRVATLCHTSVQPLSLSLSLSPYLSLSLSLSLWCSNTCQDYMCRPTLLRLPLSLRPTTHPGPSSADAASSFSSCIPVAQPITLHQPLSVHSQNSHFKFNCHLSCTCCHLMNGLLVLFICNTFNTDHSIYIVHACV